MDPENETVSVEVPVENLAEAIEEEVTPDPSAAVAIAAIEADKEIAIAEIHAETETAHIEANREARIEEANLRIGEEIWTTERISLLEAEAIAARERIASLEAQLQPPSLEEVEELTEALEIAAEPNLTDQSTPELTNSTPMEPSESAEEEKPVALVEVAGKPIFRLV